MPDNDLNILAPEVQQRINTNPIQRAGKHRLVREAYVPGDVGGGDDRQMLLDVKTLEHLLDVARESKMSRAMIPCCRLKVQLWQRENGTTYETWTILGGKPRPEPLPSVLGHLG